MSKRGARLKTSALLLFLLAPVRATAQEEPPPLEDTSERAQVEFAWVRLDGAEGCASQGELEQQVIERLGYDPFVRSAPEARSTQRIEGVVEGGDSGWVARLIDRDETGKRIGSRVLESQSPDCSSMNAAVSLALALAIDSEAALAAKEPNPPEAPVEKVDDPEEPPEGVEPEAKTDAPAEVPVVDEANSSASPSSSLEASATFNPGVLPGAAAGLELAGRVGLSRLLSAIVAVEFLPEQSAEAGGATIGLGLTAARLGACVLESRSSFRFGGCGVASLGAIYAVSFSPAPAEPGARVFASGTVDARGGWSPVERLWVGVRAGVRIPFTPYAYFVEGQDEAIFETSPVAPELGISVTRDF